MRGRRIHVAAGPSGFTLVEILIVIGIIAILASLSLQVIPKVRENGYAAITEADINTLVTAVERYRQDEGEYPGQRVDSGANNQLPILFNALFGEPRPGGPGGRSAPYLPLKMDKVAVYDQDRQEFRPAGRRELHDPTVEKFLLDAWHRPLVYRVNKGKRIQPYMYNRRSFDLYSTGPDELDQTIAVEDGGDDIGNW